MSVRPTLPPTTPTKYNVYAATVLPHLLPSSGNAGTSSSRPVTGDGRLGNSKSLQLELKNIQSGVNRMMNRVPFPLRESVQAILNILMQKAEEIQCQLDARSIESRNLHKELKAEVSRSAALEKLGVQYREAIREFQDKLSTQQDEIETRQKYIVANTNFINRLSSTNQLMIDSFNTLKSTTSDAKNNSDTKSILLRIVRDNYQCKKTINDHEVRILEYRDTVRRLDRQNRVYQRQLDDARASVSNDELARINGGGDVPAAARMQSEREKGAYARFDALLTKGLVEPISLIVKIKDLMRQISLCKLSGSLDEVVSYFCTDDFSKLFGVDAIVIFIRFPHSHSICKYSPRSRRAETLLGLSAVSLMHNMLGARTQKSGRVDKLFNEVTDGCIGLKVRHYLSIPLFSEESEPNFGVLHFLNRSDGQPFTELDEVLCGVFAENVTALMASLMAADILSRKYRILRGMDEVHSIFFGALPDAQSVTPLMLTALDVITAAELVVRRVLKIQHCRVFLESSLVDANVVDHLAFVKRVSVEAISLKSEIEFAQVNAGVAGHVISSTSTYILSDRGSDPYLNSTMDMDPLDMTLVCVPLITLEDRVLGCIQVLVDPLILVAYTSNKIDLRDEFTYGALVERLSRCLVGPLHHSLGFLFKQFVPPTFYY